MPISLDRQTVSQHCPGCGATFTVVQGSAFDGGIPIGLYLIALHGHSPDGRLAHLAVALLDPTGTEPSPFAMAVDVFTMPDQLGLTLVPWSDSPWNGEAYLGKKLEPDDVRRSPYRTRFFEVAERVIEDLPEVQDYFR
jgi:hypothetical protein